MHYTLHFIIHYTLSNGVLCNQPESDLGET